LTLIRLFLLNTNGKALELLRFSVKNEIGVCVIQAHDRKYELTTKMAKILFGDNEDQIYNALHLFSLLSTHSTPQLPDTYLSTLLFPVLQPLLKRPLLSPSSVTLCLFLLSNLLADDALTQHAFLAHHGDLARLGLHAHNAAKTERLVLLEYIVECKGWERVESVREAVV
jgi:hypothetical protein